MKKHIVSFVFVIICLVYLSVYINNKGNKFKGLQLQDIGQIWEYTVDSKKLNQSNCYILGNNVDGLMLWVDRESNMVDRLLLEFVSIAKPSKSIIFDIKYKSNKLSLSTRQTIQRWHDDIKLSKVNQKLDGTGVTIALIDTSVDDIHSDLTNSQIVCIDIANKEKDFEHGTAMAGIIVGNPGNSDGILGIAPGTKLISIAIPNNSEDGIDSLIKGIEMAIDYNVDIINMSVGIDRGSDALHNIIKEAYNKGIIMVTSAGDIEDGEILYPANYEEVICVGALDKEMNPIFTSEISDDVDIYAPGKNILTSYSLKNGDNQYISIDGSSASAAIVSGCLALLKENNTNINSNKICDYFSKHKILDINELIKTLSKS